MAWLIVICAGVQVAIAPPAVVPVAVAVGADRLIVAKAPEAVALFVAVAVAVAGEILIAANDPDALALPPADAVAVGADNVIAAHAPVADALPDALADGAVTATADSAPDALALTEPPPAETGTKIRESGRLKICHGLADNDDISFAESTLSKTKTAPIEPSNPPQKSCLAFPIAKLLVSEYRPEGCVDDATVFPSTSSDIAPPGPP